MLKKCISVLLALIMVFGVLAVIPFTAFAAESGTTGDCTWTLDGTVLTISGNGKMENYNSTSPPWKSSGATKVFINDGVTSIGDRAFLGCTSLTSIEIPDSVISIGVGAFSNCTGLANIDIPNGVTSVGGNAFNSTAWYDNQPDGLIYVGKVAYSMKGTCPAFVKIKAGTTEIAEFAFDSCDDLKSINIPDSVKSIGQMAFYGCEGLTSIAIPDSVTSIGTGAFYYCTGLTSITIPKGVTSIGGVVFSECAALTKVTIPDSITSIGYLAFGGCKSLTRFYIPDSVESIAEYAFAECDKLTSVTIPDSVKSIGEKAFGYYYTNSEYKIVSGFSIHGYENSVAEAYAEANSLTFIPMLGQCYHCYRYLDKPDYIKGYSATCTADGLTDGYICPSCSHYVEQTVIPKTGHKAVTDEAVPADCTHTGLTEGSHCSVCNEVIVAQNMIPVTHKPGDAVIQNTVNPSCTSAGSYDTVIYCSECDVEISRTTTTFGSALGHEYVYVPEITATYFHAGHTEGVQCSRCGDWQTGSYKIPMLVGEGVFCDIDGDEEVSAVDVTLLLRFLADMNLPVEIDELWADVDDDGELSIMDVTLIQRWLAGFSSSDRIGVLLG